MGTGYPQKCPRGSVRPAFTLLPVSQCLDADPEHPGELILCGVKLVADPGDVFGSELDEPPARTPRIRGHQRPLDTGQRIPKRILVDACSRPSARTSRCSGAVWEWPLATYLLSLVPQTLQQVIPGL